ncbi:hypothetical protein NQ318_021277 [Aromia moschata]|uniref:Gustatory receptor n=1 Tax=Aromia moschata TaxID=1265417 RepID=A0AAV8ZBT7_9CUCU|nr:hypothetical protein NQ318_021277 [Aromia moschata]
MDNLKTFQKYLTDDAVPTNETKQRNRLNEIFNPSNFITRRTDFDMASVSPESNTVREWKNLKVVKLLQIISTVCGLSVPGGLSVLYIIYVAFICTIQTVVWLYGIGISIFTVYTKLVPTIVLLDACVFSSIFITNLSFRISILFIHRRNIVRLTNTLSSLEEKMQEKFQSVVKYKEENLKFLFMIYLPFIIVIILFDSVMTVEMSPDVIFICIHLLYYVQMFSIALVVLQVQFYSEQIRSLILLLHKNMQETLNPFDEGGAFDELCDAIDLISESYGSQIFLIVVTVICTIIHGLNLLLKILFKIEISGSNKPEAFLTSSLPIIEYIKFSQIHKNFQRYKKNMRVFPAGVHIVK